MYDPNGIYKYWHGINYRALIALLLTVSPALPGLAASINTNLNIGDGALHLFRIDAFFGFFGAGFVYWVLSTLFPNSNTKLRSGVYPDDLPNDEDESKEGDRDPEKV